MPSKESSSTGRSGRSRRSSTSAPTCCCASSRPALPRGTPRLWHPRERCRWPRPSPPPTAPPRSPTPPRRTSRSTAASATPGNTTRTCTCGGPSRPNTCSARPRCTEPAWPHCSGSEMTSALVDDDFRSSLRSFLTRHHPGRGPTDPAERLAWRKAWLATLFDAGYAGPSWPRAHGGMELSFVHQVIYEEEYARARVPGPLGTGLGIAAPTIIRHAGPAQQDRYLRPMLRGDVVWAQGYSEPEAGSDLPALRTTARRVGDEYVVNGQKVWTSAADIADILFTLVRTGPPGSRQHGISYLRVDAHAPGVTVRPLRDLTGDTRFCEVFFTDVRVPVANRIGDENGGWPLVRTSLGHERAAGAMKAAARYRRVLDDLIDLARERGATA